MFMKRAYSGQLNSLLVKTPLKSIDSFHDLAKNSDKLVIYMFNDSQSNESMENSLSIDQSLIQDLRVIFSKSKKFARVVKLFHHELDSIISGEAVVIHRSMRLKNVIQLYPHIPNLRISKQKLNEVRMIRYPIWRKSKYFKQIYQM
jgi:hypothetical protein